MRVTGNFTPLIGSAFWYSMNYNMAATPIFSLAGGLLVANDEPRETVT